MIRFMFRGGETMKCDKVRRHISSWLDQELKGSLLAEIEQHLGQCLLCQEEAKVMRNFQELLIKASPASEEASPNFETNFWKKISEREKTPVWEMIMESLASLVPTPTLAQAAAVILIAVFIGGASGVVSAMNVAPQIKSLSGFQEYKGVPQNTLAGTYLNMTETEDGK